MKKALITGANRGLGFGFVQHYLAQGYFIYATCRNPQDASQLSSLIRQYSKQLVIRQLDVLSLANIHKLAGQLISELVELDLLINNAGVCPDESFGNWTEQTFAHTFHINVIGPALVAQEFMPLMKKGGKIIQITSGRGSLTENQGATDGFDAYGASKAALNMITRRLASKLTDRGIITASVNPGWVKTDMGGSLADLSVRSSVNLMASTIDKISMDRSGQFFKNDGSVFAW